MLVEYLPEILKIINGALNSDVEKVVNYTELLANKLEELGDNGASSKLKKAILNSKSLKLFPCGTNIKDILPVDSESKSSLAEKDFFTKGQVQVFFDDFVIEKVQNFVKYIKSSNLLIQKGVEFTPSLLLYGIPGCGKSELAKYIASEIGMPLITARLDSLISSYLGSTSKNIRELFNYANSRPCILFLDEFDAIAKLRDDQNELGELKRIVVSLLQNIDLLDKQTILLAATNHDHLLDPAIWRRFTYKIEINKPSEAVISKMIKSFLNYDIEGKMLERYVKNCVNLSGAEIKEICNEINRQIIINDEKNLSKFTLVKELSKLHLQSINDEPLEKKIIYLKNNYDKLYTYRDLSKLFNISLGQISKIINGGTVHE